MPEEAGEEKKVHHIKGKDWNTVECLAWVSKEEHNQKHKELIMKNSINLIVNTSINFFTF
jgi:hypothetical protein